MPEVHELEAVIVQLKERLAKAEHFYAHYNEILAAHNTLSIEHEALLRDYQRETNCLWVMDHA